MAAKGARRPSSRPRGKPTAGPRAPHTRSGLFICWSGPRSQKLGEALRDFIGDVIPELKNRVFFSPQIEKGARWFEEVVRQLEGARAGILCLTSESLGSPWLHFEAGALMKGLATVDPLGEGTSPRATHNRIFAYLHGVGASSLTGPLAQYQSTLATRLDTCMLVEALSKLLVGHEPQELRRRFDVRWPAFAEQIRSMHVPVQDLLPELEQWFKRKTFEEGVCQCTDQNWIGRYDGARETHDRLARDLDRVRAACPRYQVDLYERLLRLLESYAMDIRALLLRAEPFALTASGDLDIPEGIRQACERRRARIKEVVSRMLDPLATPATQEAAVFWLSDSFDQCKLLVHRREHAVTHPPEGGVRPDEATVRGYFTSVWDLDRILGYLLFEYAYFKSANAASTMMQAAAMELERYRAKHAGRRLMPLHYALRALKAVLLERRADRRKNAVEVAALLADVRQMIEDSRPTSGAEPDADRGGQVRRTLGEIEVVLETTAPSAREREGSRSAGTPATSERLHRDGDGPSRVQTDHRRLASAMIQGNGESPRRSRAQRRARKATPASHP